MKEEDFWRLVRVNTPFGKYHSAYISCKGYDYNEESRLDEGPEVAKQKLFDKLKSLGHITPEKDRSHQEYNDFKRNKMDIEHNGLD